MSVSKSWWCWRILHWLFISTFMSLGRSSTLGFLTAGAPKGDMSNGLSVWFPWELASPHLPGGHMRLCSAFFLLLCYLHSEWLFPGSLRVIVSHPLLYFKLYHGSTSLFSIEGWNLSGIHLHFPLSMPPSARWPGWQGCVPVPVPCPERRK